jgi:hypothetical protein
MRLKAAGMPSHEIAWRVGSAPSTVRLTIRRFEASGLTWPLPDNVTDTVLEARLYASQSPFEFRTLSLLLVVVLVQALEEITNQGCDLVSRFIQCEMSRFQDMDFGLWHIAGISRRAGDGEGGVVFSPNHQSRRLHRAKPFLPQRVGGNVGPVIQEQRGLNVGLARTGEKGVFVGPRIRIVTIGMGARSDMPLPRRLEGREVGLEVLELLGRIRPILPARVPERA